MRSSAPGRPPRPPSARPAPARAPVPRRPLIAGWRRPFSCPGEPGSPPRARAPAPVARRRPGSEGSSRADAGPASGGRPALPRPAGTRLSRKDGQETAIPGALEEPVPKQCSRRVPEGPEPPLLRTLGGGPGRPGGSADPEDQPAGCSPPASARGGDGEPTPAFGTSWPRSRRTWPPPGPAPGGSAGTPGRRPWPPFPAGRRRRRPGKTPGESRRGRPGARRPPPACDAARPPRRASRRSLAAADRGAARPRPGARLGAACSPGRGGRDPARRDRPHPALPGTHPAGGGAHASGRRGHPGCRGRGPPLAPRRGGVGGSQEGGPRSRSCRQCAGSVPASGAPVCRCRSPSRGTPTFVPPRPGEASAVGSGEGGILRLALQAGPIYFSHRLEPDPLEGPVRVPWGMGDGPALVTPGEIAVEPFFIAPLGPPPCPGRGRDAGLGAALAGGGGGRIEDGSVLARDAD